MSNKKDWMCEKMHQLVKLCESTEPAETEERNLFSPYTIQANEMLERVELYYGELSTEDKVEMMKQANMIWKVRKKIEGGELSTDWKVRMHLELEDNIRSGFKVTAIKHYRKELKAHVGVAPSLKEAKEYIDSLAQTMNTMRMVT